MATKRKSKDEIAAAGLKTNTLKIDLDVSAFNERYSVVSYYSNKGKKNLAYERLSHLQVMAVTGIHSRWNALSDEDGSVRFFVMVKKGEEYAVLEELRHVRNGKLELKAALDNLESYDNNLRIRIIANLLLNSLNGLTEKQHYNSGCLYLSDDLNFGYEKKKDELICLRMEVTPFFSLHAYTTTFSRCASLEQLKKNSSRPMFILNRPLIGENWSGVTVSPYIPDDKTNASAWQNVFIKRRYFNNSVNTVAQLNTKQIYFHSTKVQAQTQIIKTLNKRYGDFFHVDFINYEIDSFDECKTSDFEHQFTSLMHECFSGKSICIDNAMSGNETAEVYSDVLEEEIYNLLGKKSVKILRNEIDDNGIVIKVIGKNLKKQKRKESQTEQNTDSYSRFSDMSKYSVLQHAIAKEVKRKPPKISKYGKPCQLTDPNTQEVRRILLELIVKDCNAKERMPLCLSSMIEGWEFMIYKSIEDRVYGATLSVDKNGKMLFVEYGNDDNYDIDDDIEDVVMEKFHVNHINSFNGKREHKILIKEGNVYMLVDTDENPIVDVDNMNDLYIKYAGEDNVDRLVGNEMRTADKIDDYLSGYIGFRRWKTPGFSFNEYPSYSYMVGETKGKNTVGRKFKSAPCSKRIFVVSARHPERIEHDVDEIVSMLRNIFGKYGEFQAYPFPFKFLKEYLHRINIVSRGYNFDRLNKKSLAGFIDDEEEDDLDGVDDENNE